jgi:UDP-glucose 4-epimerase
MKILLTGASSFTGYWFARALTAAGHDVTATFQRSGAGEYVDQTRRRRVCDVTQCCRPEFGVKFGSDQFLSIASRGFDLLCHHGAFVTDYRSDAFDVVSAVSANTHRIDHCLAALAARGCSGIVVTGSVFEHDEGSGSDGLPAFSPYGVSKGLTFQMFRFYAAKHRLSLGKFVVPNPFGPFEEHRFTAYLIHTWLRRDTAHVRTPLYVRDNIHVSILARSYLAFAQKVFRNQGAGKTNPSGYTESQGDFAARVAREMRMRLDLPCRLVCADQTEFPEPRVRVNTDKLDHDAYGFDENKAWDEFADYYREQLP